MKSVFKNNYNRLLLFTLFSFCLSVPSWAQKHRMNKDVSETYPVSSSDALELSNRYGNVTINTWNQRQVAVNVKIEAWGKSEDQVKEILEQINIRHSKEGNVVKFHTEIESKSKYLSNNDKRGFEINYTVNMPDDLRLDLSNKYGRINMPDYKGRLTLYVAYGRVSTGELLGPDNDITVKYSSNSSFKAVMKGDLEIRYSSGLEIGKAGDIELSDRYGGVRIGEVEKIDAEIAYSSLKIQTLHKSLNLDARYSSGKIEQVKNGFKEIRVDTSYGSFSMDFDDNVNFDFEVNVRYGGFKRNLSGMELKREYRKNHSAEYAGTKGKSGQAFIKASASYGSISFY
ncbi:MAG: hypothetical protein ACPGJS_03940 [Flammeovirgaceae bacterium]